MAFEDEIIKAKRKMYPYLFFSQGNSTGAWLGPEARYYASMFEGTYVQPFKGTVQTFGTFSRSLANAMFSLEIPSITSVLLDTEREWRTYSVHPYDALLTKWMHYLLRVHDDQDDIYDGTIARGQIINIAYPAGRKIQLTSNVLAGDLFGDKIPRRVVTLDDFPNAPPENVGRAVPIIYGRISNEFDLIEEIPPTTDVTCMLYEWTPPQGSYDRHPTIPTLRWDDHFRTLLGDGTFLSDFFRRLCPGDPQQPVCLDPGSLVPDRTYDAWLENNYILIINCEIAVGAGEQSGENALHSREGYGQVTRAVGPHTVVLGGEELEPWDVYPGKWGRPTGQYGAAGIRRKMVDEIDESFRTDVVADTTQNIDLPVILEVVGRSGNVFGFGGNQGAFGNTTVLGLTAWNNEDIYGGAKDLILFVSGYAGRRNGAEIIETPPGFPDRFGTDTAAPEEAAPVYQTIAMQNRLKLNEWQTIEMKWKISSRVHNDTNQTEEDGPVESPTDQNQYAADGWVQVRVDGEVVIHLQEISFRLGRNSAAIVESEGQAVTYWEGVGFSPQGYASCLYITDRLYLDESVPVVIEQPDPCATLATDKSGGALAPILVNGSALPALVQASGINAVAQNNAAAPQGAGAASVDGTGTIPAGVSTYYRVTAVYGTDETSWTGLLTATGGNSHSDVITFSDPLAGTPDFFRVYQMTSPDLQLNQDMGGTLRAETFWVRQIPGDISGTYSVTFNAVGEGAPMTAATEATPESDWLVAGHAMREIEDVFCLLPTFSEQPGGLDIWTGEKTPISFLQGPDRLVRLLPGTDYEVRLIERNGHRYTIIHVTKDIRSNDDCSFRQITANVQGIETVGDGSGSLIEDGPQIVKHFLLNWAFNNYQTGPWFTDVITMPGILNQESFDACSDIARSQFLPPDGFIGAVLLLSQEELRSLIIDALSSFHMDLFFQNAIDNNGGAWAAAMFDPGDLDIPSYTEYGPNDEIIEGTFTAAITKDFLVNALNYKAGPGWLRGQANGWLITGLLTDEDSIERFDRVEKEFLLSWTRHQATAVTVATLQLLIRRYPLIFGAFQTKANGMLSDPSTKITVSDKDGLGELGWNQHVCRVLGNDFDLDQVTTTIRFMSVHEIMGAG